MAAALRLACVLALALLTPITGRGSLRAQSESVAIVVHPSSTVRGLTLDQLRRIFLAEQQYWPDGTRITLLAYSTAEPERRVVLARVYRMGEDEYRRYWVGKMVRAEVPSGPQPVLNTRMASELVAAIPGAITFMLASEVAPGVRVLRIDGRLPGEPGYPL